MPDRAVVDDRSSVLLNEVLVITDRYGEPAGSGAYVRKDMAVIARLVHAALQRPPEPRALVALSDDRRVLVVLDCHGVWNVMSKRIGQAARGFWWKSERDIPDTGQGAHEVLNAFLRDRQ